MNEFISLANKYKKASSLAEYYKKDIHTILKYGDKIGINLRIPRKLTDEQIQDIIDRYDESTSGQLSKEYNVSVSRINQIWTNAGLKGKAARIYNIKNENAFSTIDAESAYLLGFIGSDGCIYSSKDTRQDILSIQIQEKDEKIINLFQKKLETKKPISYAQKGYVSWQISSNKISSDLKKLGLTYRKTYSNTIANIPDIYIPHLIRGYVDGDGHIGKFNLNKPSKIFISISGYFSNLEKIKKYCEKRHIYSSIVVDKRNYQQNENADLFGQLSFGNKTDMYCFLKMIYKDCSNYYMDRKKNNADDFIKYIENSNLPRDKHIVNYYNYILDDKGDIEMKKVGKFEKVSFKQYENSLDNIYKDNYDIKEIYNNIKIPKRATLGSAGYDFFIPYDIVLSPGNSILIPTGIKVQINDGWVLKCYPRSGLGFKYRLQLNNTVGIIDSDYYYSDNEGHIFAKITNDSKDDKIIYIKSGEGFMQGIFVPYGITIDDDTNGIRNGGFGSTGVK